MKSANNLKLAVLKFGSSILPNTAAIPNAVHEVYSYIRRGYKVILIVSAIGDTTNNLIDSTKQVLDDPNAEPQAESYAELLATGELAAAALFTLALDRAGIPTSKLSHKCLITKGPIVDAEPVQLDTENIEKLLQNYSVLVLPGFIGSDAKHEVTLLGRGGSDFTAIFVGWTLAADCCVVYKDTHGIFTADPNITQNALPYTNITYKDCLNLPYPVIQYKAVKFAEEKNYRFKVKALTLSGGTEVGANTSKTSAVKALPKLRVVLVGLGTVGLGVYKNLSANPDLFEIVGVGVNTLEKHKHKNISEALITNNLVDLLSRDYDVLIELMGGTDLPEKLIVKALKDGHPVITANKALIAEKGQDLMQIAMQHRAPLYFSAAIAGVVPVIEILQELKKQQSTNPIKSISGILNGTCNYILDKLKTGMPFSAALTAAQLAGFAEADPKLDISGQDTAQKLQIIARLAFDKNPTQLKIVGIENLDEATVQNLYRDKCVVRLIANCYEKNGEIIADVKPCIIKNNELFAKIAAENNAVLIAHADGSTILLHGKGAGRWPTAEAVYGDLLELLNSYKSVTHPQLFITS